MFTKIGEYLKPVMGRRDHMPTTPVNPVKPDKDERGGKKQDTKHKNTSGEGEFAEDSMIFSLDAVTGILQEQISEDIDLYQEVRLLVKELKKRRVTEIAVAADEDPLEVLARVAREAGILK